MGWYGDRVGAVSGGLSGRETGDSSGSVGCLGPELGVRSEEVSLDYGQVEDQGFHGSDPECRPQSWGLFLKQMSAWTRGTSIRFSCHLQRPNCRPVL